MNLVELILNLVFQIYELGRIYLKFGISNLLICLNLFQIVYFKFINLFKLISNWYFKFTSIHLFQIWYFKFTTFLKIISKLVFQIVVELFRAIVFRIYRTSTPYKSAVFPCSLSAPHFWVVNNFAKFPSL